ncbi:MAG: 4Fe-4S binding protein, partial [Planctomycetes bacterium]|nr:4Fe-4S binding protein [Planctomycetota bacterium]
LPAADRAAKAAIEKPLRDKAFRDASPRLAGRLRRTNETLKSVHILYDRNPSYLQTGVVGGLFAMLVLLQIYQRRFWCRKVCPLGALFGLAGMKRPLGVYLDSARCTDCGKCRLVCPTGAIQGKAVSPEECIFCGLCTAVCPADALGVRLRAPEVPAPAPPPKVVPGRREFLVAAVAGAAAWPVLAADRAVRAGRGALIRPPGAQDEERFLDACIRCGECIKACPENALQPAGLEEGLAGLWTPRIVPVMGYCDYYCLPDDSPVGNFCATVCPTGAIMKLTPKEKHETRIGTASIRTDLCIPYVEGIECGVCVEHCPVKAIKNEFVEVRDHETGGTRTIQRPRVDKGLCIGCGECEHVCPLDGTRGIYVKPAAG